MRLALKGEAAEVLCDLPLSEQTYDIAWNQLIERYEDESSLISEHVKSLINLPSISREWHTNLRQLQDSMNRSLRVLKNLGQSVEHWNILIIHLVVPKLDNKSKIKWQSKIAKIPKTTLIDFNGFLKERYKILLKSHDERRTYNSNNQERNKTNSRSFVVNNNASSTTRCALCMQNHTIQNCPKFLELNSHERYDEAKRLKLCINCLRKNHFTKDCNSSKCRKCSKSHNTLLHFENSTEAQSKTGCGVGVN